MSDAHSGGQGLVDRVWTAIRDNRHFAPRQLQLEADRGRVTLRGVVHSYYHKQMVQETLRRLDGVEEIENLLEVNWSTSA